MQITKLVVLGAVELLGTGSGYDIYQYLEKNQIDKWTEIQKPSIYHSLRQLEKELAIERAEEKRSGRYPVKVLYRITDKGRRVFDKLQEEAFLGIFPRFYGFKVALKFNVRRSNKEIYSLAMQAIVLIDKHLEAMDRYLEGLSAQSPEYQRDAFFIEHDRRLYCVEKEWIAEAAAAFSV